MHVVCLLEGLTRASPSCKWLHPSLFTCRVGNSVFKKAFHTMVGTSYRIIQGADPVPTLPPAFM